MKLKACFVRRVKTIIVFALFATSTLTTTAGQDVTVRMPKATTTVSEALISLQAQTDYKFTWDRSFDIDKTVTLPTSDKPFSVIMDIILNGSTLIYAFHENYVLIREPAAPQQSKSTDLTPVVPDMETIAPALIMQKVYGTVDFEGNALPLYNAVVTLSTATGATFVATTDTEGRFEMDGVPTGEYTLIISHLDYGTSNRNLVIQPGIDFYCHITLPVNMAANSGDDQSNAPRKFATTAISKDAILGDLKPIEKQGMPVFALKTNLVHDAFATINLGVEVRLSKRLTLDIPFSVNQWKGEKRKNIFLVQPELRWWITEPFNGHFVGVHLHYAHFGVGNVDIPLGIWDKAKDFHFQGDLYGVGISYGYQWILARRLNLEANIGVGYFRAKYDKFDRREYNTKVETGATKHYFGPTKAGISLIYIIK